MKLKFVTLTGADNSIDPSALMEISGRFPFVEWGILLSKSQLGGPRFPDFQWQSDLMGWVCCAAFKPNISIHLCGRWLRDLLLGDDFVFAHSIFSFAQRVQLNFHAEPTRVDTGRFHATLKKHPHQFIFQIDGNTGDQLLAEACEAGISSAAGLYDISHGAGILPHSWPSPERAGMYGYAGGLGPENVLQQIELINKAHEASAAASMPLWIDMETKVRTEPAFDLAKCVRVLEQCAPLFDHASEVTAG